MTSSAILIEPLDLSDFQERLEALPGSTNNLFEQNTWKFKFDNGRSINIDFNDQLNLGDKYPDWPLRHAVDWVSLTKRVWVCIASEVSLHRYVAVLHGVKLLWAAMGRYELAQLTRDQVLNLLEFFLMHGWRQGNASKNLELKSYVRLIENIKIRLWKRTFSLLGLDWISRDVTESFFKKKLRLLIPLLSNGELTYKDWFQGGSFNRLTLDRGRYYVEHCLSVYENYYSLASALASTFRNAPSMAALLGYSPNTFNNVLSLVLSGNSVVELKLRCPGSSLTTLEKIHQTVTQHYQAAYRQAFFETEILKEPLLKELLIECDLKSTPENIDRFRVIVWEWLRKKDKKKTQYHLSECQPSVLWEGFEKKLIAIKGLCDLQVVPVLSAEFYQEIGLFKFINKNKGISYPRQLIDQVAKAGLTNIVALTGWRKSEFGFPISAIKRIRNYDKLDQYAFPWRYQVDWYVFKTSGKVRQLREITFYISLLSEQLHLLHSTNGDLPCLYSVGDTNINPLDSGEKVSTAVLSLWGHFVDNYTGFKQLDDWVAWKRLERIKETGASLTDFQQKELEQLLTKCTGEQWSSLYIDVNLKETWHQVREEWPKVKFSLSRNIRDRKDWLIKYRNGTLRSDWTTLLDDNIPENVKNWLNSMPEADLRDSAVSNTVINSFLEKALYPSPHSFRHMWAEAVYRRFDGDAGWMIRSQFKHISNTMWLAYIRDKDNRNGHQQVKEQVMSSLVHNYLRHNGEGYSGQLHTWLRRLLMKTSVMTPKEQFNYAERLATVEIENIKANPWGYCLLKRRTRSKAKCTEKGEPMRHNASPELCLGCTHNLMQSENVEWSLLHISSNVEILRNPVVPALFKDASYELVKNVTQHVRTLNSDHEALPELKEVLSNYKHERVT